MPINRESVTFTELNKYLFDGTIEYANFGEMQDALLSSDFSHILEQDSEKADIYNAYKAHYDATISVEKSKLEDLKDRYTSVDQHPDKVIEKFTNELNEKEFEYEVLGSKKKGTLNDLQKELDQHTKPKGRSRGRSSSSTKLSSEGQTAKLNYDEFKKIYDAEYKRLSEDKTSVLGQALHAKKLGEQYSKKSSSRRNSADNRLSKEARLVKNVDRALRDIDRKTGELAFNLGDAVPTTVVEKSSVKETPETKKTETSEAKEEVKSDADKTPLELAYAKGQKLLGEYETASETEKKTLFFQIQDTLDDVEKKMKAEVTAGTFDGKKFEIEGEGGLTDQIKTVRAEMDSENIQNNEVVVVARKANLETLKMQLVGNARKGSNFGPIDGLHFDKTSVGCFARLNKSDHRGYGTWSKEKLRTETMALLKEDIAANTELQVAVNLKMIAILKDENSTKAEIRAAQGIMADMGLKGLDGKLIDPDGVVGDNTLAALSTIENTTKGVLAQNFQNMVGEEYRVAAVGLEKSDIKKAGIKTMGGMTLESASLEFNKHGQLVEVQKDPKNNADIAAIKEQSGALTDDKKKVAENNTPVFDEEYARQKLEEAGFSMRNTSEVTVTTDKPKGPGGS